MEAKCGVSSHTPRIWVGNMRGKKIVTREQEDSKHAVNPTATKTRKERWESALCAGNP